MRIVLGVAFVVAVLFGALYLWGTRYAVHQKITLSVETPDGLKTAYAVQKLSFEKSLPDWVVPGDAGGSVIWYSGEAVALELAPGKHLLALLRGTPRAWDLFFPRQSPELLKERMAEMIGQSLELTPKQYPLLVTFDDVREPASVRRVDPADLAATFGPGYRLNSITMTITDEPVTEGKVERVLGWLGKHPETPVLPKINPTDFSFEAKLRQGDFIRR